MNDNTRPGQAGFDAISRKMNELYPKQEGIFYGTIIPYILGGNDPLDGVEVWKSEQGTPHWHYVTYGFTELYEKENEDTEESGYGFELTFLLKRDGEEQPPAWPINLLQNLARYVFSSGNVFGPGHHINCNGPIALDTDTKLTALGFWEDPELGEQDTPNGHMIFLQAVALTSDEMDGMMCWNGKKFLETLEKQIPFCITDLARGSQMENTAFRKAWTKGVERDGSTTAFLYMDEIGTNIANNHAYLCLGAGHTKILNNMLRARTGKGRDLSLYGQDIVVLCQAGDDAAVSMQDSIMTLTLSNEALQELYTTLQSRTGTYQLTKIPLTIEIVPTYITDQNGTIREVIE